MGQLRLLVVKWGNLSKYHSLAVVCVLFILGGCHPEVEKRAYGFVRVGKVAELLAPETNVETQRLLVRHDERGFSAMSTLCTVDLSPLVRTETPQGILWVSNFTTSKYANDGTVISGPAKANLPYFELILDSGKYAGPKDTLYAKIGYEKPAGWRLQVP